MDGEPMIPGSQRTDYDALASRYDGPAYRRKSFDAALAAWLTERGAAPGTLVVDVCCGTGAQLAANQGARPDLRYAGVDASAGMLAHARARAPEVSWIRADAAAVPIRDAVAGFVSNQFALHHVGKKEGALEEAARVLRPGGRLSIRNLDPFSMPGRALYRYFPASRERDFRDFLPVERIESILAGAGLTAIRVERLRRSSPVRLRDLEYDFTDRGARSELTSISDDDYRDGISRLRDELIERGPDTLVPDEQMMVTITADKPS